MINDVAAVSDPEPGEAWTVLPTGPIPAVEAGWVVAPALTMAPPAPTEACSQLRRIDDPVLPTGPSTPGPPAASYSPGLSPIPAEGSAVSSPAGWVGSPRYAAAGEGESEESGASFVSCQSHSSEAP